MQKDENSQFKLESVDFGRRVAVENSYMKNIGTGKAPPCNIIFDESSNFILYSTMLGIKVVNFVENKLVKLLGKVKYLQIIYLIILGRKH